MSSELTPAQELQLQADVNGARGFEQEQAAIAWAEDNGYEISELPDIDGDPDHFEEEPQFEDEDVFTPMLEEPVDPNLTVFLEEQQRQDAAREREQRDLADEEKSAFEGELEALERVKGRPLTSAEVEHYISEMPSSGPMPNLVEKYGEKVVKRTQGSTEDRRKAMYEAADDGAWLGQQEDEAEAEATTPADPDETSEDRRERMLAAAEAAQVDE